MANAITKVITWLRGEEVGHDQFGNRYYQDRKTVAGARRRRWVIYADGIDEASRVPAEHHAWLHYTINDFPSDTVSRRKPWQEEHIPNLTGTPDAYRPPGHTLAAGKRDKATGDYQAWAPE